MESEGEYISSEVHGPTQPNILIATLLTSRTELQFQFFFSEKSTSPSCWVAYLQGRQARKGKKVTQMSQSINNYLRIVNDWLTIPSLELSVWNSSATSFTGSQHKDLYNTPIPQKQNPKILGATFDPYC